MARYGHLSEADPRFIHPVVVVNRGERTPLLQAHNAAERGIFQPQQQQQQQQQQNGQGESTVIMEDLPISRILLIIVPTWIGVFLGALDSTIISTLSGPIASEFESLSIMSWLATAYFISLSACQPISGRLTDIFGRGPGLVFSNVVFAAGNLICGLSRGPWSMIFGRVVAGIGGGGLMCISTILCSDLVPLRRRGIFQGLGNICYAAGSMSGGVFGGLFFDNSKLGWRLAFLLMVPPSVISAILVAIFVRVPPKQSDRSYLSRIDFAGVFTIVSGLVLLLFGLNAGGNIVPWTHPLPLATIPLSVLVFVAFCLWEKRAAHPIIPMGVMASRTVIAACLCNFFCTIVAIAFTFYVPLYLEVQGKSAFTAGLLMLPAPVGLSVASFGVGYGMTKTGKYVALTMVCLLSLLSGLGIFAFFVKEDSPVWLPAVTAAMAGAGFGGMLTTTLLACIASVEHSQQAVVTSATYLFRSVGSTLGVTVPAAVYQNILKSELWSRFGDYPNAAEEIGRIRNSLDELRRLPEGWHDGVIGAFMAAFSGVWLAMLGVAVAGVVSASFMREHKLHSTLSRT